MRQCLYIIYFALFAVAMLAAKGTANAFSFAGEHEETFLLLKDDSFVGKDARQLRAEHAPKLSEAVGTQLTGFLAQENAFVISVRSPKEKSELMQKLKLVYPEAEFSELTLEQLKTYWPHFRPTEKRNK